MGCMEDGDRSRVKSLEMTALLMSLSGAAFMQGGWSTRKVTSGRSQGRKEKALSRKRREEVLRGR
jgi:hypothetical protein